MFCPNCGAEMGEEALFCGNCGFQKGAKPNVHSKSILGKIVNFKTLICIIVIAIAFIAFKFTTSFSDVISFEKEAKVVGNQFKNGDLETIVNNNFDFSELDETSSPEQLKQEAINGLYNSKIGKKTFVENVKSVNENEKLKKIVEKLKIVTNLKYDLKKVAKKQVRLTISLKLPGPEIISNEEIEEKTSTLVRNIIFSNKNIFGIFGNINYEEVLNSINEFDEEILEIIELYQTMDEKYKQDFTTYLDFYKIDGHWRYKLSNSNADIDRIGGDLYKYGKILEGSKK